MEHILNAVNHATKVELAKKACDSDGKQLNKKCSLIDSNEILNAKPDLKPQDPEVTETNHGNSCYIDKSFFFYYLVDLFFVKSLKNQIKN